MLSVLFTVWMDNVLLLRVGSLNHSLLLLLLSLTFFCGLLSSLFIVASASSEATATLHDIYKKIIYSSSASAHSTTTSASTFLAGSVFDIKFVVLIDLLEGSGDDLFSDTYSKKKKMSHKKEYLICLSKT